MAQQRHWCIMFVLLLRVCQSRVLKFVSITVCFISHLSFLKLSQKWSMVRLLFSKTDGNSTWCNICDKKTTEVQTLISDLLHHKNTY